MNQRAALRAQRLMQHVHPKQHICPEVSMMPCAGDIPKPEQPVDVAALRVFLDGPQHKLKDQLRDYLTNTPIFKLRFDLTLAEQRAITLERARAWLSQDIIQEQLKGGYDPEIGFAIGEIFSFSDASANVKAGVMTFLFGGAIRSLGEKDHADSWLHRIAELKITGMFCMTESNHGSNVREIETLATYDPASQTFDIHTPHAGARKMYIGNALHGKYATVFARLILPDGTDHGPHAFIVPMRDEATAELLPGVHVEDMGAKEGLNGVDNGVITFTHVRIPLVNMLTRFARVSPEGVYSTDIKNPLNRFNAMLAALTATRVALSSTALGHLKVGLFIAIHYGFKRRQFGASGEPETQIMAYQTHQLRLMPALAACVAMDVAQKFIYLRVKQFLESGKIEPDRPMSAFISGMKAMATWQCVSGLQTCRECCGGNGFMHANRIAGLKADSDVFATFEGDNVVMLQQVAKDLLAQYNQQFESGIFTGLLSYFTKELKAAVVERNPYAIRKTADVRDSAYHIRALEYKEGRLLHTVALRLLYRVKQQKMEKTAAWNACLSHLMEVAITHIKRVVLTRFSEAITACNNANTAHVLKQICDLYALDALHNDAAWFVEHGFLSASKAKAIRDLRQQLCYDVAVVSREITDAWGIPEVCVHAPIALPDPLVT
eukprot:TRINITY_DN3880_c0_g1_i1.p1 TRINITY_DN3880_c0_g1~~TRINITY_DN3880_c0_g1_i1.p1  ORF type:complete len:663 (+),score=159.32 TRINITY_DN3880_c0_g1_i1:72-2060(+)